jgi:hypothetical protein
MICQLAEAEFETIYTMLKLYAFKRLGVGEFPVGWRVGCNPPSVEWHSAYRATCASGRILISAVCPFHVQDGRFTGSTRHPRQLSMPHWHLLGWTFRFCSVAGALAPRPCGRCTSTRERSFLRPHEESARKPHANSPAQSVYGECVQ